MIAARTRRAIPITIVLTLVAIGLILYTLAHWRRGTVLLGAAALVGAGLRAFVPDAQIGVLAVRSRTFDVIFLLLLGVALELLAFWPE
ncbi:DUF3017 domain-containing protein [Nakamurella lactea]|uniref:DUF3017 domain-containing protein n=1 Tax=Nakamurella lactea TaxID=459515 RepID=UPI00041A8E24|nr:DUF3017 domain-containing protein [Nakamurella lactea]